VFTYVEGHKFYCGIGYTKPVPSTRSAASGIVPAHCFFKDAEDEFISRNIGARRRAIIDLMNHGRAAFQTARPAYWRQSVLSEGGDHRWGADETTAG